MDNTMGNEKSDEMIDPGRTFVTLQRLMRDWRQIFSIQDPLGNAPELFCTLTIIPIHRRLCIEVVYSRSIRARIDPSSLFSLLPSCLLLRFDPRCIFKRLVVSFSSAAWPWRVLVSRSTRTRAWSAYFFMYCGRNPCSASAVLGISASPSVLHGFSLVGGLSASSTTTAATAASAWIIAVRSVVFRGGCVFAG